MSIVAPSITHSPFSDTEIYSLARPAELPSHPHPPATLDLDSLSAPFPVFPHRHTSPFPAAQSFSALGPPEQLAQPPPPAPKPPPMDLPALVHEFEGTGLKIPNNIVFPPTPDPSPPNSKVLFPDAMVKLAPPAEEFSSAEIERLTSEETPRRLPLASIDAVIGGQYEAPPIPAPTQGRPRSNSQLLASVKSPEAKPARPKAMKRSQTALPPSSIRMGESLSADSRARLRSDAMVRHSQSRSTHIRSSSPGFPRTLTDTTVITPRHASTPEQPDLGGPDGLEAKVVLLGSQGVGKTSLILRYTTRLFSPSPAAATIGSSLHTRKLVHSGVRVKLQIWDTAGQERFRSMAPIYYRGAHVCVLVYDISDRTSFDDVRSWLEELKRTVPKETVLYVVGAKVDLAGRREVSLDVAKTAVRRWLKPAPPPVPAFLSPPLRSNYRSSVTRESSRPNSPAPTPLRSTSHDALASLDHKSPTGYSSPVPSKPLLVSRPSAQVDASSSSAVPFPRARPASPPPKRPLTSLSPLQISSASSKSESTTRPRTKSEKRLSFPALASPTAPTSATNTDHVSPSITPASPSRHGISGGHFSISGVLGYSRANSMSGAVSNLTRLAEDHPASRSPILINRQKQNQPASSVQDVARRSASPPPRVRTDTSTFNRDFNHDSRGDSDSDAELRRSNTDLKSRRKSEEWTSAAVSRKSWKMGEGPSAAEALGEFGDGVRKRQSAELLGSANASMGMTNGKPNIAVVFPPFPGDGRGGGTGAAAGNGKGNAQGQGRKRGGSLGRDSRLYGLGYGEVEEEVQWGIEVEGVRLGECSAMTGEGVEALFKSISSVLVQKKDKIERERTIRRQGSVMLTDPKDVAGANKKEGRGFGCC